MLCYGAHRISWADAGDGIRISWTTILYQSLIFVFQSLQLIKTWELNTNIVGPMQIEWNKAIRKIIRLPYETHRNLLPLVINGASFSDQHVSRIKKFVSSFLNSKNHKIRFIGEMAMEYSYGPLGRNCTRINSLNNVDIDVDSNLICDAKAITDLIDVRDGLTCLPGLDRDDVELLIEELCCN